MTLAQHVRTWLIVSAVVALSAVVWSLVDNYLNPPLKAAISIQTGKITIQNLNRIDWESPEFTLDDGAKLKISGVWHPGEDRTFNLLQFRNPATGRSHDLRAKKGFEMMVFMPGFTTTFLHNWDWE